MRRDLESGQALAEFVIILTVIMSLCAGMIYIHRLMTLNFWAQQEARLVAFEETWAARESRDQGVSGASLDLDDDEYFYRPWVSRNADVSRETTPNPTEDGMNDLLGHLFAFNWKEYFLSDPNSSFIPTAYAKQSSGSTNERVRPVKPPLPKVRAATVGDSRSEKSFIGLLEYTNFGKRFCRRMDKLYASYSIEKPEVLKSSECSETFDRKFGRHLASNVDFPEFFRSYGYQLELNPDAGEGLVSAVEEEVASQFYSFFDNLVSVGFLSGPAALGLGAIEAGLSVLDFNDDSYLAMLADARYMGSSVAMGSIALAVGSLAAQNPMSQDWQAEQDVRDFVLGIIHDDASDTYPLGLPTNGFWLVVYDFIPLPSLTALTGGLFDGLAYNVFTEESEDWDKLIEEPNIAVQVSYDPSSVTPYSIERRFDTEDRVVNSRFYLLTQPWHIIRRDTETDGNPFRSIGGQFDDMDMSTEEAILRRRVFGLYIVPSQPTNLLQAFSGLLPSEINFIDPFIDALDPVDTLINTVKGFVLNSPLNDFLSFMGQLPGGELFNAFRLPEWPAVRPMAYPGTEEIEDDRLAGEPRTFEDYIQEQKDFNPAPNPEYH